MRRYRRVVRPACTTSQHDQTLADGAETFQDMLRRYAMYADGGDSLL